MAEDATAIAHYATNPLDGKSLDIKTSSGTGFQMGRRGVTKSDTVTVRAQSVRKSAAEKLIKHDYQIIHLSNLTSNSEQG